ncbi:MAG TPA: GWxTD domain-containing protein [Bacteroidetes bacterium]|nr:GWxTD domain-containing protein [Bacteroidota bacterium]
MKKKVYFLLFTLILTGASLQLQARDLLYYVDICSFYNQEGMPYLELYLDIDARTVSFTQTKSGAFQGTVAVSISIEKKPETGVPVYQRSFDLLSPEVRDSSKAMTKFGIMDVRRITLEPGTYILTGLLKDKMNPGSKQHKFVQEIIIEAQSKQFASLSDIEFIQSFSKTKTAQPHSKLGYDILPLVTNSTFSDMDSIKFYLEVYNIGKESEKVYFANIFITRTNSNGKMTTSSKVMRKTVKPLDILTASLNIRDLPGQTYYLNVDIYNQAQKLLVSQTKKFFVINSTINNQDLAAEHGVYEEYFNLDEKELDYYLRTLYFISTSTEQNFVGSLKTFQEKKNYFFNFWDKRRENNSTSPAKPWKAYESRVKYANKKFKAAHLEGWRTDRGRVMLIYGPPNDVERNPSSNTKHPYDVWTYYKIKTQSNRQFVFFNSNTATNDYTLLHSNATGEYNNPRWEFDIVRTSFDANLDNNDAGARWQR